MITTVFAPFPYLETERLSLWQLEKSDAPYILELRADNRVNKYIERKKMLSLAEADHFIAKINAGVENGEWMFWAIAEKKANKFLGTVCLWNLASAGDKAELGYELMYDAQGKGYMREVIPTVLHFGFSKMELKVIEAVIKTGNKRSIKLAEKNGFNLIRTEESKLIYSLAK